MVSLPERGTKGDFVELISESKALNSDLFSQARLLLLNTLAEVQLDGATFRDLKSVLGLTDGALYSNMQALNKMGYVTTEKITYDSKELELYKITKSGMDEWKRVKAWLCKLSCGGNGK